MLYGIGCDLCSIPRLEKSLNGPHAAHFAARVFGARERAALGLAQAEGGAEAPVRCSAHTAASAAADFAAKEAFLKAAGRGLGGFALTEIEALRLPSGAPVYALSGRAQAWLAENGLCAQLSLSHEAGLALAFCTLEKNAPPAVPPRIE